MKIINVSSLDYPELHPYRTLRRPLEHIRQGIFVAEGEKVVRQLISSELKIISMLMTHEWYTALSPILAENNDQDISIYVTDKSTAESIVGYNLHQGIMAVAHVPEERGLEEIIRGIIHPHLLVAIEGLVNAENVGVVVRNCAAFGVDAILVGELSSSPYLRRAVRNSMGTVFKLPVVHCHNLIESIAMLQNNFNTKIIAAHPHENQSVATADFSGNVCVVFGNEGDGITQSVLDACDQSAAIPMMNETDSLNVASASAVFLYEARKQRENLAKRKTTSQDLHQSSELNELAV